MLNATILIGTTYAASTSYIPFPPGMVNAQNYNWNSHTGDGIFATTAFLDGVWDHQLYEEKYVEYLRDTDDLSDYAGYNTNLVGPGDDRGAGVAGLHHYITPAEGLGSMNGMCPNTQGGAAFYPGTTLHVKVKRLKSERATNSRSGIQVNRALYKGNKLVFRYVGMGEIIRPL